MGAVEWFCKWWTGARWNWTLAHASYAESNNNMGVEAKRLQQETEAQVHVVEQAEALCHSSLFKSLKMAPVTCTALPRSLSQLQN